MKKVDKTWVVVHISGHEYEANLVASRLKNAGLHAVVLTKKDSAFSLTLGDMSRIFVLVPPDEEKRAKAQLSAAPFTDQELTDIAEAADPYVGEDEFELGQPDPREQPGES